MNDDDECPQCGGEGYIEGECTCGDDCCCCLEPEPPACPYCALTADNAKRGSE